MYGLTSTAAEILELSHVPGGAAPGVYAVGLPAKRITLADQQQRAINLVWALLAENRLASGDSLAIVGAGVAGVTAAAYALQCGLSVHLFEANKDPFAIQQGSSRWVHPNIYDWPDGAWRDPETHLPCMNWSAGSMGGVIRQLRKQWTELANHAALSWAPATRVTALEPGGPGWLLETPRGTHGPFPCVLLAIGFGEEREVPELECKPYWRNDDVHQRLRSGGTLLVSGCGDGGLVDAIRGVYQDFQHEALERIAAQAGAHADLVAGLRAIERNTQHYLDGASLTKAIREVSVPADVTESIRSQLTGGVRVILNGMSDGPFSRASCMLNRFIVAQLMNEDVVEYRQGAVDMTSIIRDGSSYSLELSGVPLSVQALVLRHGPQRASTVFARVDTALEIARAFLATYSAGVDRTRFKAWSRAPAHWASLHDVSPMLRVTEYHAELLQGEVQAQLVAQGLQPLVRRRLVGAAVTLEIQKRFGEAELHASVDLSNPDTVVVVQDAAGNRGERQLCIDPTRAGEAVKIAAGIVVALLEECS